MESPAAFYRGIAGEERFTITIDRVARLGIAGTIRRR
jgi:hypothetical protein